jgi:uncharacterized membrane protein
MTVRDYLASLSRELRVGPLRRRRILAEVEDHLREAAARDGEGAAIDRFGPAEEVASRLNRQWRVRTRLAAVAALGGVALVFFSVQGLMDGVLPPAPWPEDAIPSSLAWQSRAAEGLVLVALLLALAALAGRGWSAVLVGGALVALALAAASVSLYEVERAALAGSPSGWQLAGVFALRAAALAPAALLLAGRLRVPRILLT